MKKELDWTFSFKMVLVHVGLLMLLGFALGTTWILDSGDEDNKSAPDARKTNPRKPLRAQIVSFNTITLFFLLMSVAEFRTDGFLSPRGVDPDTIPPKCKAQQQAYTTFALGCAFLIILYNYFVFSAGILAKPSAGNIRMEKVREGSAQQFVRCVRGVKTRNTALVVEVYPHPAEFFFFVLIAVLAVLMYALFVLANYGVIQTKLFDACAV